MALKRYADAVWAGDLQSGKGSLSTPQSGLFEGQNYSFKTRFGDEKGTNPEELLAVAHAGCFTMALSFALAKNGVNDGSLETEARVKLEKDGDGFKVTRSDLRLTADVPSIDEARLRELAEEAKANCPISKLLDAEMDLEVSVRQTA